MAQPPGKKSLRRILLESLLAGAMIFALQSANTTVLLLRGDLPYDPVVAYAFSLLLGMLAWLVVAAILIGKSWRRE